MARVRVPLDWACRSTRSAPGKVKYGGMDVMQAQEAKQFADIFRVHLFGCPRKPRGKRENGSPDHEFERDKMLPEWHGWHAARRGLGTNLYRLGVPEKTIQAILRHANVSTTNTYYIKSAADDTRVAMAKLEKLVIGNAEAANLQTGNEVATLEAEALTASIQ